MVLRGRAALSCAVLASVRLGAASTAAEVKWLDVADTASLLQGWVQKARSGGAAPRPGAGRGDIGLSSDKRALTEDEVEEARSTARRPPPAREKPSGALPAKLAPTASAARGNKTGESDRTSSLMSAAAASRYAEGPKVDDAAWAECGGVALSYMDYNDAIGKCNETGGCIGVHDNDCDGTGWHLCCGTWDKMRLHLGSKACTMMRVPTTLTVTTTFVSAACACQDIWEWNNATYGGCSHTPDKAGQWCIVREGDKCEGAVPEPLGAFVGAHRKECEDPCVCADEWEYLGRTHYGCAETEDHAGMTWCKARGGGYCKDAQPMQLMSKSSKSLDTSGDEGHWMSCQHPCACMDKWEYNGEQYEGCAETPDWKGSSWCPTQGQDCRIAVPYSAAPCEKGRVIPSWLELAGRAKAHLGVLSLAFQPGFTWTQPGWTPQHMNRHMPMDLHKVQDVPACVDVERTGLTVGGNPATCADLTPYCDLSSYSDLILATCPRTCNKCDFLESVGDPLLGNLSAGAQFHPALDLPLPSGVEVACADKDHTGLRLHKQPASCKQLVRFCTGAKNSDKIQEVCPRTCNTCDKVRVVAAADESAKGSAEGEAPSELSGAPAADDGSLAPMASGVIQQFDANSDGRITYEELYDVLHGADPHQWNEGSVARLLGSLDVNKDGDLEFDELDDWLTSARNGEDTSRPSVAVKVAEERATESESGGSEEKGEKTEDSKMEETQEEEAAESSESAGSEERGEVTEESKTGASQEAAESESADSEEMGEKAEEAKSEEVQEAAESESAVSEEMGETAEEAKSEEVQDDDIELEVTEDPGVNCVDQETTDFKIAGRAATCPLLKLLCHSERLGGKISSACPKTCGVCENSTLQVPRSNKCVDRTTTGLAIDGVPAPCDILAPLCSNSTPAGTFKAGVLEKIRMACPATCGVRCQAREGAESEAQAGMEAGHRQPGRGRAQDEADAKAEADAERKAQAVAEAQAKVDAERKALVVCADKSYTGFNFKGKNASCTTLASLCQSPKYGTKVQVACPVTCKVGCSVGASRQDTANGSAEDSENAEATKKASTQAESSAEKGESEEESKAAGAQEKRAQEASGAVASQEEAEGPAAKAGSTGAARAAGTQDASTTPPVAKSDGSEGWRTQIPFQAGFSACADKNFTGFIFKGHAASCQELALLCSTPKHGQKIRAACPLTCNVTDCSGTDTEMIDAPAQASKALA